MSYQVFARKYRPQTFDEVIGQDHVTKTLKNAILQSRLAHAYLFVGPRGTGKTSTARILARSLNCVEGPTITPCGKCSPCTEIAAGRSLDVLEFDAASNTQVDKVRELIIETVQYAPASGRYKMYIVDEVHMLSNASFNALLKTLEEPPGHVLFVFATTEVNKVPLTILSRCQRFDLRRIPAPLISRSLLLIAANESVSLHPAAAEAIARGAEGGMRDASSMLDQLVAFCGNTIAEEDVLSVFGFTSRETMFSLADAIFGREGAAALEILHEQSDAGRDIARLMGDFIAHLRNLLVAKADPRSLGGEFSPEEIGRITTQAARIETPRLLDLIEAMSGAESKMRWAPNKRLHFEIALIRAIEILSQATLDEVLAALGAIRGGAPLPSPAAPPAPSPAPAKPAAPVAREQKNQPQNPPAPAAPPPQPEEPAPAPAAPVRQDIDLASLWREFAAKVSADRPLIAPWLQKGALVSFGGNVCVLAFGAADAIASESLSRPNQQRFLEETLSRIVGTPVELRIEKRDSVEAQPLPETAPAKAESVGNPDEDPLIKAAIEAFEAEIASAPGNSTAASRPK